MSVTLIPALSQQPRAAIHKKSSLCLNAERRLTLWPVRPSGFQKAPSCLALHGVFTYSKKGFETWMTFEITLFLHFKLFFLNAQILCSVLFISLRGPFLERCFLYLQCFSRGLCRIISGPDALSFEASTTLNLGHLWSIHIFKTRGRC